MGPRSQDPTADVCDKMVEKTPPSANTLQGQNWNPGTEDHKPDGEERDIWVGESREPES